MQLKIQELVVGDVGRFYERVSGIVEDCRTFVFSEVSRELGLEDNTETEGMQGDEGDFAIFGRTGRAG